MAGTRLRDERDLAPAGGLDNHRFKKSGISSRSSVAACDVATFSFERLRILTVSGSGVIQPPAGFTGGSSLRSSSNTLSCRVISSFCPQAFISRRIKVRRRSVPEGVSRKLSRWSVTCQAGFEVELWAGSSTYEKSAAWPNLSLPSNLKTPVNVWLS